MSFEIPSNQEELDARRERIEDEINNFKGKISEKFADTDLEKVTEALDFMLKIHLPQADRVDGKPFASHPLAVAERVMELSDNPELAIAALIHDSVEDQSDRIFLERFNRKYPDRNFLNIKINEEGKKKHKEVFKAWSFRELKEKFGDNVKGYVESMTNHDYYSLADDSGLEGDAKHDFINKLYAEHVEDIISDPELFTLKLADLSVNIDLHSLDSTSEKYQKLKRKYKSVIEAVLTKLNSLEEGHPIYGKKDTIITELNQIYTEQYSK
ncbi:MAG: HD domain-containing protein [Candidatus Falkowbacteria bacterium]